MPGEHSGEIGREFVNRVGSFLDGNFGFHVYQTSYEASDAASVLVDGERVRFDMILDQTQVDSSSSLRTQRVHFFCECKSRTNVDDLRTELKEFLKKALKTMPELQRQFSDNYGFVFICNKPFGID